MNGAPVGPFYFRIDKKKDPVYLARFYRFVRVYFHFNAKGYFNVYILSDCPQPLLHRHEQTTQL